MRMNALMLGFSFNLPYHVMRCAGAAGYAVHVLGNGPAAGLRWSRRCAGFHRSAIDFQHPDEAMATAEIRALCAAHDIRVVLPSDDVSTRLLSRVKPHIGVACSALPEPACFDSLNDKSNFHRLCVNHAVRVPETREYDSIEAVQQDVRTGRLCLPLTVKPTNRSGAVGVHHLLYAEDVPGLDQRIDYRPILVQRFVKGRDVGVNVLCRHGKVIAHTIQEREPRRFRLFENADLLDQVTRLVGAAGLHGPANIDAIIAAADGLGYLLECNPRFWYTIYMSMVLGRNFVARSLAEATAGAIQDGPPWPAADADPAGALTVRLNKGLLFAAMRPWASTAADWRMIRYHVADPVPYWCEKKEVYDDSHIAVDHTVMAGVTQRLLAATAPRELAAAQSG